MAMRLFHNMSLRGTFALVFTAVTVVPTLIIVFYSVRIHAKDEENLNRVIENSIVASTSNIENDFFQIETYMSYISTDSQVLKVLRRNQVQYDLDTVRVVEIGQRQAALLNLRGSIECIAIFGSNGMDIKWGQAATEVNLPYLKALMDREDVISRRGILHWFPASTEYMIQSSDDLHIAAARPVHDMDTGRHLGFILMVLSDSFFFDYASMSVFDTAGMLSILRDDGTVLLSDRSSVDGTRLQQTNTTTVSRSIGNYPIRLSLEIPRNIRSLGLQKILLTSAGLVVLLLVVIWVLSVLLARHVTRPIVDLVHRIENMYRENAPEEKHPPGRNEILQLREYVTDMSSEIEGLIESIVQKENERSRAEIRSLQNQINPHFLYNVLNSVKLMIGGRGHDDAERMLVSLGRILHRFFAEERNLIPLQEEIDTIHEYANMYQIMYRNRFDIMIEVEECVADCLVPKFTLQPLVENAIYHGILPNDGYGLIHLTVSSTPEALHVSIRDNGVGIAPEPLARLQSILTRNSCEPRDFGIGINNVNQRLKLIYGTKLHLSVTSEYGQGTEVRLTLPVMRGVPT